MMKLVSIALMFYLLATLSSCYTMLFSSMGVLDKQAKEMPLPYPEKQIIFIPMHHIGKQEFYADVRHKIDSLRKEGYALYFEGVKFTREKDSLLNDTLAMKLRKIMGVDLRALKAKGGYIDTVENKVMGRSIKAVQKHSLVNQPRSEQLFVPDSDHWADVYLSDALAAYESKYGVVKLEDCDYKTSAASKYSCTRQKANDGTTYITLTYRNEMIVKEIMADPRNKIAIFYGARHYEGVLKLLKERGKMKKIN